MNSFYWILFTCVLSPIWALSVAALLFELVTWYKNRVTPLFGGPENHPLNHNDFGEHHVTKQLWFRDLALSPEPIMGIYECQIDRPSYTVDQYLVWVGALPNGTPYCGHEWVRVVDILNNNKETAQ